MTFEAPQNTADTIARLGTRKAMRDATFFVGRKKTLLELEPCLRGNAAWLSGVKRIGKSSLARQLLARSNKHSARTIWVGMGDVSGLDFFDQTLTRVLSEAGITCLSTPRSDFEALANSACKDRPILIVFDEFDRIATNLQMDEQAFLRRLTDHCEHFGYLFITRTEPSVLVEQVPDEMSRLLGCCTAIRLGALERGDVKELMARVANALGCEEVRECAETIWSLVGGHSIAVMTFAKAIAVHVATDGWRIDAFKEIQDLRKQEIAEILAGLWRDLVPPIRQALIDRDPEELSDSTRTTLRSDGYFSRSDGLIRPAWLCEVGEMLGIAPSIVGLEDQPLSRVERLHALMYSVNAISRRGGYPRAFEISPELLRHYLLTRIAANERSLAESVNHLSKVIYEGARKKPGGGAQWRLPSSVVSSLKKHIGYQQLVALRNFCDHDPEWDMDADQPNSNFVNEGDVYSRHCGTRNPSVALHWLQVRNGLLQDLIGMLEQLETEIRLLPALASR